MTEAEKIGEAFVLSLFGGIFILLGGGTMAMFSGWGSNSGFGMMGGFGGFGGMMGPVFGMMGGFGFGYFGLAGLTFGVIVIVSALMLNRKPQEHTTWGILIIVFSALSIFGSSMGGFGVGLVLGIIGGVLALTWTPPPPQTKS